MISFGTVVGLSGILHRLLPHRIGTHQQNHNSDAELSCWKWKAYPTGFTKCNIDSAFFY